MDEMKLQEIKAPYTKSWMSNFEIKGVKGVSEVLILSFVLFCHHLVYLARMEHAGFCLV